MMNPIDRVKKCHDYVLALEEEKKKIQVFQRELPLCLQLITQAIDNLRQAASGGDDEMADASPVLAEFLPLKPSLSLSSSENDSSVHGDDAKSPASQPADQKPDWLRSVQLWNQQSDPAPETPVRPVAVNVKKIGGAFQPFEREKHGAAVAPPPAAVPVVAVTASSSTTSTGGGGGSGDLENTIKYSKDKKEKEEQSQALTNRKARRCWSPELHRRFVQALHQLGGSHAATPKQIRELMKVDGLTNDEVKSHLQKYRLHTRRPTTAAQTSSNASTVAPQFVVVGGIWVPPAEFAVVEPQPTNSPTVQNEIYAPVALHPKQNLKQQQRLPTEPLATDGRYSDDSHRDNDEANNSISPTSSSSSQTTTLSPSS